MPSRRGSPPLFILGFNAYDAGSSVIASAFLEAGPLVLSRIENEP